MRTCNTRVAAAYADCIGSSTFLEVLHTHGVPSDRCFRKYRSWRLRMPDSGHRILRLRLMKCQRKHRAQKQRLREQQKPTKRETEREREREKRERERERERDRAREGEDPVFALGSRAPPWYPRPEAPEAPGPAQPERTHANQREGGRWRMIPTSASSQERRTASEQGQHRLQG